MTQEQITKINLYLYAAKYQVLQVGTWARAKKKNNKIIGYYIHADGFTDFLTLKELAKNFDYLEQEQKEEILNSFDD